jgi:hypothetical protein
MTAQGKRQVVRIVGGIAKAFGLDDGGFVSRASCPRFEGGTPSTRRGQDGRDTTIVKTGGPIDWLRAGLAMPPVLFDLTRPINSEGQQRRGLLRPF